jgi:hypothetical protein
MVAVLLYPALVVVALWVLFYGDELRRGKLSMRSIFAATTLAAAFMLLARWVLVGFR